MHICLEKIAYIQLDLRQFDNVFGKRHIMIMDVLIFIRIFFRIVRKMAYQNACQDCLRRL